MIHEMNLNESPFNEIKCGDKDIEMRLYDDRRKKIKIGDVIMFTNRSTDEKMFAEVLNLFVFDNFEELYSNFDKTRLGYKMNEVASPSDMEQYYSKELIQKNKVIAIEIQVI